MQTVFCNETMLDCPRMAIPVAFKVVETVYALAAAQQLK